MISTARAKVHAFLFKYFLTENGYMGSQVDRKPEKIENKRSMVPYFCYEIAGNLSAITEIVFQLSQRNGSRMHQS